MPKAWYCIPSVRPVDQVIPVVAAWKKMGYGVALWREIPFAPEEGYLPIAYGERLTSEFGCDIMFAAREYPGYAKAVNAMAAHVLRTHPEVDWLVTGGDDTAPDPNKTGDEIADGLSQYFYHIDGGCDNGSIVNCTWGVCQPTGDRWADDLGVIIERIAGSPWLGREWCRRANAGKGPLWPEFRHMFGDEHCMEYAKHLGVFLQRPDLTHYHAHAQRIAGTDKTGNAPAPAHMAQWNTRKHWDESKAIFERLKSTNFAECMPIP